MASLNRVTLIGNLGRDPETRYMPSGDAITNITIATSETWKDKATGEKKENLEWHRIVFFGKLAEIAGQFLKKGSLVYVEGSLRTRKWQDKDGEDRFTTEIKAEAMQMLGTKPGGGSSESNASHGGDEAQTNSSAEPVQASDPTPRTSGRKASSHSKATSEPTNSGSGFNDIDDDIPY